jgi:Sec-independent protein translocase protein TatA
MLDFIKNISPLELGIIALLLILFFGSRIITNFAKTTGETVKEVKKIKKELTDSLDDSSNKK